jgi:hypothetical protein
MYFKNYKPDFVLKKFEIFAPKEEGKGCNYVKLVVKSEVKKIVFALKLTQSVWFKESLLQMCVTLSSYSLVTMIIISIGLLFRVCL